MPNIYNTIKNATQYRNGFSWISTTLLATNRSHKFMRRIKRTSIQPFNARILELGFIRAESAVIGLLKGWFGMFISTITTLFCGAVSRTHIYLSDSIVTCVNVMNCGFMPMLGNCNHKSRDTGHITLNSQHNLTQQFRTNKLKKHLDLW